MANRMPTGSFRVEIDGVAAGHFREVSGLSSEQETVETSEGSFPEVRGIGMEHEPRGTQVGASKWGSITLKKGYTASDPLMHKVTPGEISHKVNPGWAMSKVNPNPAMSKVNPNPAMSKVNPAAMPMKAAARLVLRGFVLADGQKQMLRHWVDPGAPQKATPRGQIVMLDLSGRPVNRWQFYEAWPCKWHVPELDSDSSSDSGSGHTVELVVGQLLKM